MFSWENIKDTYKEKVKKTDSVGDKTLGVLEVIGKSIVSGATVVVKEVIKEAPLMKAKQAEKAHAQSKEKAEQVLKDPNASYESKEKAEFFLKNYESTKEKLRKTKAKIQAEKNKNEFESQLKKLLIEKKNLEDQLIIADESTKIRLKIDINKVLEQLNLCTYEINREKKDIKRYQEELKLIDEQKRYQEELN